MEKNIDLYFLGRSECEVQYVWMYVYTSMFWRDVFCTEMPQLGARLTGRYFRLEESWVVCLEEDVD